MDEMIVAPRKDGMTGAERKTWRRPTLERLNANEAGSGGPKIPLPATDGANPEYNAMS